MFVKILKSFPLVGSACNSTGLGLVGKHSSEMASFSSFASSFRCVNLFPVAAVADVGRETSLKIEEKILDISLCCCCGNSFLFFVQNKFYSKFGASFSKAFF